MQQQQQQAPPIDLKNTTSIENFDGGVLFTQGVLLRTVSRFVMGTEEDALLPIPVFYDSISGKILESSIPKELREEYKDYIL
tara:strand:+ start:281 stop:526 length:246 start_codon:yes stop_codon:yes gene_type:complete